MELASRDVISRAEQTEIDEGRGIDGDVLLDLRHLGAERIIDRLHGTRELSMTFAGVDPIHEPIPVRPGAHYHMGGIDTGLQGQTSIEGLYAAGECACVSVHGANRLGGNSLMETITYGRRAGSHAGLDSLEDHNGALVPESTVRDADARIRAIYGRAGGQRPWQVREELATVMYDDAGVFRTSERLERCLTAIGDLRERGRDVVVDDTGDRFNTDLVSVLELESMLEMADCLATGALARRESRGAHTRLDHPERDDEQWMKHTLAWCDVGKVRLDYKPVTVTRFEPMVRSY
jgi:succinate dehydrogenase / fumarate reductase flavoprotein subunit